MTSAANVSACTHPSWPGKADRQKMDSGAVWQCPDCSVRFVLIRRGGDFVREDLYLRDRYLYE